MKKSIIFLFALANIFVFRNNSTAAVAIGTEPVIVEIQQSKDAVWDKIINLMIANGVSLKTVDKASGILQTGKIGLSGHAAAEGNKDGVWVVAENLGRRRFPEKFNGELTFYIKEEAGKTRVSISLSNIYAGTPAGGRYGKEQVFTTYSTKQLEQNIGAFLNSPAASTDFHFDNPEATPPGAYQGGRHMSKRKRIAIITGAVLIIVGGLALGAALHERGGKGGDGDKIH